MMAEGGQPAPSSSPQPCLLVSHEGLYVKEKFLEIYNTRINSNGVVGVQPLAVVFFTMYSLNMLAVLGKR
jgi:hypothetical protein